MAVVDCLISLLIEAKLKNLIALSYINLNGEGLGGGLRGSKTVGKDGLVNYPIRPKLFHIINRSDILSNTVVVYLRYCTVYNY